MKPDDPNLAASRALLAELHKQGEAVRGALEDLEHQRAELNGRLESLRIMEARLRGGMIAGFPRLDMEGGAS